MDANSVLSNVESGMQKAVEYLHGEFAGLRTGKASPALVENLDVLVASYGSSMKLKSMAVISTPDSRSILIQPFDPSTLNDIQRAINESRLNLNPVIDARSVRVPIPTLSEERRKDLVKYAKGVAEEARVRARAARRDGMDSLKKLKADSSITEDEQRTLEDKIQKLTDKTVKSIDEILSSKEKDIMTV